MKLLELTLKWLPQAHSLHSRPPTCGVDLKVKEYLRRGPLLEEVGKEGQAFEGYGCTLVLLLLTLPPVLEVREVAALGLPRHEHFYTFSAMVEWRLPKL